MDYTCLVNLKALARLAGLRLLKEEHDVRSNFWSKRMDLATRTLRISVDAAKAAREILDSYVRLQARENPRRFWQNDVTFTVSGPALILDRVPAEMARAEEEHWASQQW